MKTDLTTLHTAMLAVLLGFAPLVGAAGESNLVHVQFREVDTLFANRIRPIMLVL